MQNAKNSVKTAKTEIAKINNFPASWFPAPQPAAVLSHQKSSFSALKIMHMLRRSTCYRHEALIKFDGLLSTGLETITNLFISVTQWIKASLPVSAGGWKFVMKHRWHYPHFLHLLQLHTLS